MNHAQMPEEMYELYALGILEPGQATELDAHLREGCQECEAKLRDANRVVTAMAGMADQVSPPASLRRRVLATVAPAKKSNAWIWATVGLAAASVALFAFSIWLGNDSTRLRDQLAAMRVERSQLRAALEFMSRPETRTVQFGNIENAPRGRVFVSRNGGVVFVGSNLPALPRNKAFELWVVPSQGAPKPAGVFRPNTSGESVDVSSLDVNASGAAAVAVSVEPVGGSGAPTTKPFLIVPLS